MPVNYLELISDDDSELPKPEYIHVNTGSNRRERRHGYSRETGKHFIVPAEYRELPTNTPYRKSVVHDPATVETSE